MIFSSPCKYVQDPGALGSVGNWAALLGKSALVIVASRDRERLGGLIAESLARSGVNSDIRTFDGDSTMHDIVRLAGLASACDMVIGVGSGRIMDASKAVAHFAQMPVIVCPTVASTDAPCSGLSVVNEPQGGRYLPLGTCPDVVIADSAIIASAPVRFTVAGMGDALTTCYEARACERSGHEVNGRASLTARTLSALCRDTILTYGEEAKTDLDNGELSDAVENIIEANILISGLGFENCGLAAAHALERAITEKDGKGMHGEKAAFGLLVQLTLEGDARERERVAKFCKNVGLPVTLDEIGLPATEEVAAEIAANACAEGTSMANMPVSHDERAVAEAILAAHAYGRTL